MNMNMNMNSMMPQMAMPMQMPMQQVRVPRAPHVPVPPVTDQPLEISREMRQQLRAIRRRAFERHQENAQWTRELLGDAQPVQDVASFSHVARSTEELEQQLAAKKEEIQALQSQMTQHEQNKFDEMMTMLKSANSQEELERCQQQVDEAKKTLLTIKQRKMEIVKL